MIFKLIDEFEIIWKILLLKTNYFLKMLNISDYFKLVNSVFQFNMIWKLINYIHYCCLTVHMFLRHPLSISLSLLDALTCSLVRNFTTWIIILLYEAKKIRKSANNTNEIVFPKFPLKLWRIMSLIISGGFPAKESL